MGMNVYVSLSRLTLPNGWYWMVSLNSLRMRILLLFCYRLNSHKYYFKRLSTTVIICLQQIIWPSRSRADRGGVLCMYSNYSMTKVRARKWRYGRFLPHTGCPVAASPIRKSQPHLCAVSAQGSQLLVVRFHLCQGDLNLRSLETCHSALGQTHLE